MTCCPECQSYSTVIVAFDLSAEVPVPILEPCPVCGPIFEAFAAGDLDAGDRAVRAAFNEAEMAREHH